MCSCHSILECCVTFSGVKLSIRSFVLLLHNKRITADKWKGVNSYKSPIKRLQDSYQEITGLL